MCDNKFLMTLIFGTDVHVINETKKLLPTQFEIKDMGEGDVILGINIRKTNDDFFYYVNCIILRKCSRNITTLMRFM